MSMNSALRITKIIVPLDGSKLAECVLPHVEDIASGCQVPEVVLISVTEAITISQPLKDPHTSADWWMDNSSSLQQNSPTAAEEVQPKTMGRKYTQADKYLHRIQDQLKKKGIDSQTEVLIGNAAESIVGYAQNNSADLIIMASHGRSGLSRWSHGSTADKVFRATCIPLLMVRAQL